MPSLTILSGLSLVISLPSNSTFPKVDQPRDCAQKRALACPLAPIMESTSPLCTSIATSSSALTAPYATVRPEITISM